MAGSGCISGGVQSVAAAISLSRRPARMGGASVWSMLSTAGARVPRYDVFLTGAVRGRYRQGGGGGMVVLAEAPEASKKQDEGTAQGKANTRPKPGRVRGGGGAFTESALLCEPVGWFQGMFRQRNGTPRQGSLIPAAKGVIRLNRDYLGPDMHYSLEGLEDFTHLYVLFHFHANPRHRWSLKVSPPRLNGQKRGVFSTRAPIRPNPIGLSIVKLEEIYEDSILVSGVDLVDDTPILDIKPYLPAYDSFPDASYPSWIHGDGTAETPVEVEWSETAERQLGELAGELRYFRGAEEAREGIRQVLASEPRSAYRREKCQGQPYQFTLDDMNVRCVFSETDKRVLVYAVERWALGTEQPDPSTAAPEYE